MMEKAALVESASASRNLCYFLVATAMANVGGGGNRSLEVDALTNQAIRKGYKSGTQYDVAETLAVYGKNLDFLEIEPGTQRLSLLDRPVFNQRRNDEAWCSITGQPRSSQQARRSRISNRRQIYRICCYTSPWRILRSRRALLANNKPRRSTIWRIFTRGTNAVQQ